ncbi:hypothetical protein ABZP36_015720 [Zizania latifolia]
MDGGRRRSAAIALPQGSPAWRRLVAWLQLLLKAFAQRYGEEVARWRPAFLLFVAFLAQRGLLRAYLSWKESRLRLRAAAAAAVTVQAAFRAMTARRELSLRRRTRAAVRIQAQWRAHTAAWDYLTTRRAALICQCAWRRCAARRQLGKLRLARIEKEMAEEMCRLREMVDVLQQAVEDAEVRVIAEREAAKKAIAEAPPVIKEKVVLVEDAEKVSSLTAEVGRLKDLLGAEIKATFDAKKAHAEAELRNEKLARLLGVEEVKNKQLQDSLKRMEVKASDLDEENKMLRQAIASMPAIRSQSNGNRDAADLQENQAPNHSNRPIPDGRLVGGLAEVYQVEAKYPALAFKQQLTALLEKVYGIIRHNLKKELSPLLSLCIQAPRTFVVSPRGSCSQGTDLAQQASMAHWQSIIKILTNSLNVLKSNYVPPFLICKLFTQVFSFINVQLFNSLLLRRECCSFSNGEYVKAGLDEIEHWCFWLTEEYAGSSWDELKHIRQAVALLILEEKHKSLKEITDDYCPALSMQQLYRISTMYCDDKYGTLGIPPEVVSSMRTKMVEGSSSPSVQDDINSFLLDDDFSIPFSIDDIAKLMVHIDIADMDLPPLIQENKGSAPHLNP